MSWRLRLLGGVGSGFVPGVQQAIRNGYWKIPPWFPGLVETKPMTFTGRKTMRELKKTTIEDRLRNRLLEKKPEYAKFPVRTQFGDPRWYLHPVDLFISKQVDFMSKGYTEEKAFEAVEDELTEETTDLDLEVELATQQAIALKQVDRTAHKLKESLFDYKLAAIRFRDEEIRKKRDKLEQIIHYKKESGDAQPLEWAEMETISPLDVMEYLKLYPEDSKHFSYGVLEEATNTEDEFRINFDDSLFKSSSSIDDDYLIKNINEQQEREPIQLTKFDTKEEEIDSFDNGVNPILERELQHYLANLELDSSEPLRTWVNEVGQFGETEDTYAEEEESVNNEEENMEENVEELESFTTQ